MKRSAAATIAIRVLAAFVLLAGSSMLLQQRMIAAAPAKPAFSFKNIEYFHRWSHNTQHEFTPNKQEDLKAWTDMVTINIYPDAKDGDAPTAGVARSRELRRSKT